MPTFLHVQAGSTARSQTTRAFASAEWKETRMDSRQEVHPDILGSCLNMDSLQDASFDAVYSSRNLEHFYAHQVEAVLKSFLRVLKPDGFLVVISSDIQGACELVAQGKILDPAYESPAGPVTPFDILYGFRPALAANHFEYACKSGFTAKSLGTLLAKAGFASVWSGRNPKSFTLAAVATRHILSTEALTDLVKQHFPQPEK